MTEEQKQIIDKLAVKLKPLLIEEIRLKSELKVLSDLLDEERDLLISMMNFLEIKDLPDHKMKLFKHFKGYYFKILGN